MSRSRRRGLVASAAICVLSVSTADAQTPAPERTVAAQGLASVKVIAPKDRTHEAPIRAAVESAEAKALPRDGGRPREGHDAGPPLGPHASEGSSRSPTRRPRPTVPSVSTAPSGPIASAARSAPR